MTDPVASSSPSGAAGSRFSCTPGGGVARGRRRLKVLLLSLTGGLVVLAVVTGVAARRWPPALIALGMAAVTWIAWRLSTAGEPLWLEIGPDGVTIQSWQGRLLVPFADLAARRLDTDEVAHLERLASFGGIVATTGGFDSHRLGEFDLHASDLAHAVLLEAGEARLVVTPDDPDAFLARLRTASAIR